MKFLFLEELHFSPLINNKYIHNLFDKQIFSFRLKKTHDNRYLKLCENKKGNVIASIDFFSL